MLVNEVYGPTIQGEGPYAGKPVMFLRLYGCVAPFCDFCDTPYTWDPALKEKECHKMEIVNIEQQLRQKCGENISTVVITGGEPCAQPMELIKLVEYLEEKGWDVHIETSGKLDVPAFENAVIICSPKQYDGKFKITDTALEEADCFKFVIGSEDEFDNMMRFIYDQDIESNIVYLMPKGETREKQLKMMEFVANKCIHYGFKFSPRLQTLIWDIKRKV